MSITYFFHQSGVIPGIPGTFGNCRVELADDDAITIRDLVPRTQEQAPEPAQQQEEAAQPIEEQTTVIQEPEATQANESPDTQTQGE